MVSYVGNPEMLTVTLSPLWGTLTPMPSETLLPGLTDSASLATVRVGATGVVGVVADDDVVVLLLGADAGLVGATGVVGVVADDDVVVLLWVRMPDWSAQPKSSASSPTMM